VAGIGGGHHHHGHHKAIGAVAKALNMSPAQLVQALQQGQAAGQTPAQVIASLQQTQGVPDLQGAIAANIGTGNNQSTNSTLSDQQKSNLAAAWINDVSNMGQFSPGQMSPQNLQLATRPIYA